MTDTHRSPEQMGQEGQEIPDEAIVTSPQAEWYRDAHGIDAGANVRDRAEGES